MVGGTKFSITLKHRIHCMGEKNSPEKNSLSVTYKILNYIYGDYIISIDWGNKILGYICSEIYSYACQKNRSYTYGWMGGNVLHERILKQVTYACHICMSHMHVTYACIFTYACMFTWHMHVYLHHIHIYVSKNHACICVCMHTYMCGLHRCSWDSQCTNHHTRTCVCVTCVWRVHTCVCDTG